MSWVPLGVERVACMTAAYLKILPVICRSYFGIISNSVPIPYMRRCSSVIFNTVEESLCCIKVGLFKVGGLCESRELERLLVKCIYSLLDKACQRLGAGTYFTSDKAYGRADISQGVVGKRWKSTG